MHFLIFLLIALAISLYFTFKLLRQRQSWRYLFFLLLIDIWLLVVLVYLFYSAIFDSP
jgi:hypothetical protein